ncbi:MAG: glycosyltransferase family 2 protein [Candidatus Omnitrophica bacterium]|nr:glycosyltransferase family 2 protein [Candidatus Omnitrophota bacterium]
MNTHIASISNTRPHSGTGTTNELAVIIPVYNEADGVEKNIGDWIRALSRLGIRYRIFAINDGSTDATGAILEKIAQRHERIDIIHKQNEGHGTAILQGYRIALKKGYPWIFQTDSDGQFYEADFENVWRNRKSFDCIIGYRYKRNDSFSRLLVSGVLRQLIFLLWGRKIADANSPYRLMRHEFLKETLERIPEGTFAPNIFLSVLGHMQRGVKMLEIPVRHKRRICGCSSIRNAYFFRALLRSFAQLCSFRWGGKI